MRFTRMYATCTATLLLTAATALAQTAPESPSDENGVAAPATPAMVAAPANSILSISLPP
jgi:hypothetical protein